MLDFTDCCYEFIFSGSYSTIVMRFLLLTFTLTILLIVEASDVPTAEEEKEWEDKSLAVLNHLAEKHITELEQNENSKARSDDEAILTRLKHNMAVHVSRLVIVHPLGDGKKRIRKAFEKSKLRQLFFWVCHLFFLHLLSSLITTV